MGKKREIHFAEQKQIFLMQKCGISERDAIKLADITATMPFYLLDALHKAIGIIRKGEHNWTKEIKP